MQFCDGTKPCQINDDQLRSFLIKANAKENTYILSLIGCPNIKGRGLEPLSCSLVLQDIDLRVIGTLPLKGEQGEQYGPTGLDERWIFVTLTSMLNEVRRSFGDSNTIVLRRMAIRTQLLPADMSSTLKILHSEREKFWLRWKPSSCLKCKVVKSDKWPEKASNFCAAPDCKSSWWCPPCKSSITPYERCIICKSDYCKDCTPQLVKCSVCEHFYCTPCAMPPSCPECTTPKCQWCSNLTKCNGCNKKCCASHGFESCGKCDNLFCVDCSDEELLFCVVCNKHYCGEDCHKSVHR